MNAAKRGAWFLARCGGLFGLIWLASIEQNPLVRAEAMVGLSPSLLERLFGIEGPFSGMTEGVHQLAHGNLSAAIAANPSTPAVALVGGLLLLIGVRPRLDTRRDEVVLLALAVMMTIANNLA